MFGDPLFRQNKAQEVTIKVDAITDKYPAFQFTVVVSTEYAHSMSFTVL